MSRNGFDKTKTAKQLFESWDQQNVLPSADEMKAIVEDGQRKIGSISDVPVSINVWEVLGHFLQPWKEHEEPFYPLEGDTNVVDVNVQVEGVTDDISLQKEAEFSTKPAVTSATSKKQLKTKMSRKEVTPYVTAPVEVIEKSIRQVSKIEVHLCCAGGFQDLRRFLEEKMEGNVVCTHFYRDRSSNEGDTGLLVRLLALNYKGRRKLASTFIAPNAANVMNECTKSTPKTFRELRQLLNSQRPTFMMKINEGPVMEHLLCRPKCLDPPYLPVYYDPCMKVCEHCKRTNCSNTCQVCKGVMYCGRKCQKADWKVHKKICEPYQKDDASEKEKPVIQAEDYMKEGIAVEISKFLKKGYSINDVKSEVFKDYLEKEMKKMNPNFDPDNILPLDDPEFFKELGKNR